MAGSKARAKTDRAFGIIAAQLAIAGPDKAAHHSLLRPILDVEIPAHASAKGFLLPPHYATRDVVCHHRSSAAGYGRAAETGPCDRLELLRRNPHFTDEPGSLSGNGQPGTDPERQQRTSRVETKSRSCRREFAPPGSSVDSLSSGCGNAHIRHSRRHSIASLR